MASEKGRPAKGGNQVFVRLPSETVEAVDARVAALREQNPGMSGITRSDLLRDIIVREVLRWAEPKPAPAKGNRRG